MKAKNREDVNISGDERRNKKRTVEKRVYKKEN